MFFSNEILTKKGGQFAVVWLVGNFNTVHGSRRLGLKKSDYVSVDVVKACGDMLNPRTQFALRLSSTLLMGIIRVYEKQITIVYDEVKSMWIFLKKGSFMRPENVELPTQRSETFALPNPLYHYDKEMGNEQSDIRFYTSLGEKALFEGQGAKPTHESRADSAYFTISFGDQEITNNEYENTMGSIREESPAKRRKISKDSFLDIIEDPHTPLKIKEKAPIMPIEVPGVEEFDGQIESDLLNISEDQLNEKFAQCSQLQTSDLEMTTEGASMFGAGYDSGMLSVDPIQEDQPSELGLTTLDPVTEESNIENPLLGLQGATDSTMFGQDDSTRAMEPPQADIGDMILKELSSRIQTDPILNEMNKENEPPVSLHFDETNKENQAPLLDASVKENLDQSSLPPISIERTENVENIENAGNIDNLENAGKGNDETLVEEDPDKENRDPNAIRRSQRATKKPLRLAQEKAFDATNSFILPQLATPKDAPTKRKRKRQLVVDKKNQLSVKEMKKFMKNSRQALCTDPVLVHKIRPTPEELFNEPHRSYLKKVPELMKLWGRCAHTGDHDLTEMLERQLEIDADMSQPIVQGDTADAENIDITGETSRKRPRSSVLSDVEIARFGGNSTLQDISEFEGDLTRLDSTGNVSRDSDAFTAAGFRTSTVLKPQRGSGMVGPMLSPIQQLENFEESEIQLDPQELLPIMEEPTIQGNLSDLPQPDLPQLSDLPDMSSDIFQDSSTMFGQQTDNIEMTEGGLTPVREVEMRALSPEKPKTPLIERLSGVPQEETIAGENMSTFQYFPDRESQKFYGFVKRKFSENEDSITFEKLVPRTHTRKTAALAFYQLLVLKKFNHIHTSQDEETYFGDISIKLRH
ncbi:uncharacterized protein LOC134821875 [Bolinopsis microptera]|uniref:uncharacterized protein LOC134821875 n=1 Tax=Bolinopsis microptera TaxID=2820187 RepID=UPI00307ABC42